MAKEWICQSWPVKIKSDRIPKSLREMIETAQKYNTTISVMRAPKELKLNMPAFHHPFAKNRHLQTNSRIMRCLQENHEAKTIRDLKNISINNIPNPIEICTSRKPHSADCRRKANELLNRVENKWNPNHSSPQRHNLWHTPRRIKKFKGKDPAKISILFNPDTRSHHSLLEGIRIFGKTPGHKSKEKDPFMRERNLARINQRIEPSRRHATISTDGSAIYNRWENAKAGIGVWYADGSARNITLRLEGQQTKPASNSRAELGAILEALRQNEMDDLEIESDSLTSLRAICTQAEKHEDLNWIETQNADLLKSILINLRTRPARTSFKWVKGHDVNYGNIRADALADAGRDNELQLRADDEEWTNNHAALQDGARLQALEARHTYKAVLKWHTKKTIAIPHQEVLEEAKNRIEEITGLRPTNEKLLKGIKTRGIPPRLRDHTRNMLTSKIKCGPYWANIPGHTDRAFCSFCKRNLGTELLEDEKHIWLNCENNRQESAWETARTSWQKTTNRPWPLISLGLIKGATALVFNDDYNRDSERLRILIFMTTWAIWKSRNKNAISTESYRSPSGKFPHDSLYFR